MGAPRAKAWRCSASISTSSSAMRFLRSARGIGSSAMRSISRINASTIASRWKNASIIGNMWPSPGQMTLNVSSLPMPATLADRVCSHSAPRAA